MCRTTVTIIHHACRHDHLSRQTRTQQCYAAHLVGAPICAPSPPRHIAFEQHISGGSCSSCQTDPDLLTPDSSNDNNNNSRLSPTDERPREALRYAPTRPLPLSSNAFPGELLPAAVFAPSAGDHGHEDITYGGPAVPSGVHGVVIDTPLVEDEPYRILPLLYEGEEREVVARHEDHAEGEEEEEAQEIGDDEKDSGHINHNEGTEAEHQRRLAQPAVASSGAQTRAYALLRGGGGRADGAGEGSSGTSSPESERGSTHNAYENDGDDDDDDNYDEEGLLQEALRRSAEEYAEREQAEERWMTEESLLESLALEESRQEDEQHRAMKESLDYHERRERSEERRVAAQSLREYADAEHAALVQAMRDSALEAELEKRRHQEREEREEKDVLKRSIKTWQQETTRRVSPWGGGEASGPTSEEDVQKHKMAYSERGGSSKDENKQGDKSASSRPPSPSTPTLVLRHSSSGTSARPPHSLSMTEGDNLAAGRPGTWSFESPGSATEHQNDTGTATNPETEVSRAMEEVQISQEVAEYIRKKRLARFMDKGPENVGDKAGERIV